LWKIAWRLLKKKKRKLELSYDPAIPVLGKYLKECKSGYNKRHPNTHVFFAALFLYLSYRNS
jgi:hypothetical protein